jgi:hypothetical protein
MVAALLALASGNVQNGTWKGSPYVPSTAVAVTGGGGGLVSCCE